MKNPVNPDHSSKKFPSYAYYLAFTLLYMASGHALAAQFKYVTDQLKINMRSGTSTSHKIVKTLPTGHKLEILDKQAPAGYSKVRSEDGEVGYVLSRYLDDTPGPRERLEIAEARLKDLQQAPDQLAAELDQLRTAHNALLSEHEKVSVDRNKLQVELEDFRQTFAKPVQIASERNELRKQVSHLIRENEELKQQNRELKNSADTFWFMLGGGAIILGLILGLILPNLRRPQRHASWNSL